MIKKVNYIKNFGVFKDYRRSGNIQDFAKVNIIYGWNYSGKTIISRVFQSFENEKLDDKCNTAEFELEDYEGNKGNQENLNINNCEIKVFNTDFIRDNISLEGEAFDTVLLLGEESIKAQDEIKLKRVKLLCVKRIINKHNSKFKSIQQLILDGLTQKASYITDKLQIVQSFTRTHLKEPIFDKIKHRYKSYLISEEKSKVLLSIATASEKEKLPIKEKFSPLLIIDEKLKEAKTLLSIIPELSKTIQYFKDNKEASDWVEKGIILHKEKNKCEYCSNEISEERTQELLAHFSEDLRNHKELLNNLINAIGATKLEMPKDHKSEFYKEHLESFESCSENLDGAIKSYNNQLDNLIEVVKTKREEPFEKITDFSTVSENISLLNKAITNFNDLIDQHNGHTSEFDNAKSEAIEKLKKHYTAKFIEEINLKEKEILQDWHKTREDRFKQLQIELETEIAGLDSAISKAHIGKKRLNEFIQKFLGRDEIKVVVVKEGENERFKLQRNDTKAVNLSEGEKTAIAFSFFLTKLLECKDLSKVIVYIDDPISSLDSNHIFQVNALLKEFFFKKEDPENESSPTLLRCLQLFFSTHNFDFFGLLRKDMPKPKESNKCYYYVRRINKEESIFEKLPDSIKNYSSEYHYLFEIIYKFDLSDKKDYQVLMGIPNAVRRFVELYTYSRIPGHYTSSTVDTRADALWGVEKSKRILKVLHYFSHLNDIERMFKQSDLICDIENAVSDLLELIKTEDKRHYNELEKAVNK